MGTIGQNFCVLGTIYGKPEKPNAEKGFNDPKGVYTRYDAGEQDTNRLARNEKIDKTPVKWRRDRVDTATKAFGGQWKEPPTPYAAQYPYNHVRETEPLPHVDVSGNAPPGNCSHIEEFDDTPRGRKVLPTAQERNLHRNTPERTRGSSRVARTPRRDRKRRASTRLGERNVYYRRRQPPTDKRKRFYRGLWKL